MAVVTFSIGDKDYITKLNTMSQQAGDVQQARTDAQQAAIDATAEKQAAQQAKLDAQAISETGLPAQANNANRALVTNGGNTEWRAVFAPPLTTTTGGSLLQHYQAGFYRIANATLDLPTGISAGNNDFWIEVKSLFGYPADANDADYRRVIATDLRTFATYELLVTAGVPRGWVKREVSSMEDNQGLIGTAPIADLNLFSHGKGTFGTAALNRPATSQGWGYIESIAYSSLFRLQRVWDMHDDNRYFQRIMKEGAFSSWLEYWLKPVVYDADYAFPALLVDGELVTSASANITMPSTPQPKARIVINQTNDAATTTLLGGSTNFINAKGATDTQAQWTGRARCTCVFDGTNWRIL